MILTKTPFRISFAGGGSDHFNLKSQVPGRIICTTINKYIKRYLDKIPKAATAPNKIQS